MASGSAEALAPDAVAGAVAMAGAAGIPVLTEQEFALFQGLIYREAGIYLAPAKRFLLTRRLGGRVRELGLKSFAAYYRRVSKNGDPQERVLMLDRISTNETRFFREPRQFEFLDERLLPQWKEAAQAGRRPRRARVWSAGCSTGEEPYSLAMVLLHHFPPSEGWSIDVLASDLSTQVLERARDGFWPIERADGIPERYLKRFMLKGTGSQAGRMAAGPEIRSVVRFQRLNLNDERYAVSGPFDLILCRNVLIYFDQQSKTRVIDRLLGHLDPRGYLFVGHAESLTSLTDRVRSVIPTVFTSAAERREVAP